MIDSLFGSKTRVKLLYLFMNNPGKSFYVREITRKIDEQINSVRRELSNMLEVGIIKSDEQNNKLYYEVDTRSKFYKPLHEMFAGRNETATTIGSLDNWKRQLESLGDVRVAILAGKLVNTFDNDIDLLVAGEISHTKLKNLVATIEAEKDITISYSALSYEDFYYRLSVCDQFVDDILTSKHSVVIDTENILNNR